MAKKVVITYANSVTFILKLKSNDDFNSAVYYRIKRHTMLFPQNFSLFLILLLFLGLVLHNLIYIIWYEEEQPTNYDL